jgi:hypothetical protein
LDDYSHYGLFHYAVNLMCFPLWRHFMLLLPPNFNAQF